VKKTTEFCFICGIDKQQFDHMTDETDGFKRHIHSDHNMWSYVFFTISIWEQDKDDDDGLEQYVRQLLERNEVAWIPMLKAICLGSKVNDSETLHIELRKTIDASGGAVLKQLDNLEVELGNAFDLLRRNIIVNAQQHSTTPGYNTMRGSTMAKTAGKATSFAFQV
jgi:hypothetical protein